MEKTDIDSGCYQLLIEITRRSKIKIGALGEVIFQPGFYVYTGRAKRGLRKRVGRHYNKNKKIRWHIDYLLQKSRIIKTIYYPNRLDECKIHKEGFNFVKDAQMVKNFGSSDCRCEGHLFRTQRIPFL